MVTITINKGGGSISKSMSINKKWYQRLINGDMFFALLVSELFEEFLEEAIATGITWIIGKLVSVLFIVALTQGTKIILKRIVKSITYREGNDKMAKIKNFFTKAKKILTENVVWSNKLTISGIFASAFMLLEGTDVVSVIATLPELTVYGFNVMPYLVYAILGILSIVGIGKQGFESVKTYLDRIHTQEELKITKKAKKEEKKAIAKKTKELELEARAATEAKAKALVEAEKTSNNN